MDEFIKNKSKVELSKEENQVRGVAHRSAKNISTIIKDLFKIPPSYKSKVIVSWRDPHDKVISTSFLYLLGLTYTRSGEK